MERTLPEALATPEQMAEIYQISRTTMYRWLTEGQVPGAFKVGNKWRVSMPAWRAATESAQDA